MGVDAEVGGAEGQESLEGGKGSFVSVSNHM